MDFLIGTTLTKPLLIFDLDETLVRAGHEIQGRLPDFESCGWEVYLRPYLKELLLGAGESYRLAIWSVGGELYVNSTVAQFWPQDLPIEFVWTRDRCTRRFDPEWHRQYWIKCLKKTKRRGYSIKQTLIVENDAYKCQRNYGNAIYVEDYLGQEDDNELELLLKYLKWLSPHPNYRTIEKRGWRSFAKGLNE